MIYKQQCNVNFDVNVKFEEYEYFSKYFDERFVTIYRLENQNKYFEYCSDEQSYSKSIMI